MWPSRWLAIAVLVSLCLLGWEVFWRSHGFRPSLSDDTLLWSLSRMQATEQRRDAIVLVGSSRMQMDIHRDTLASQTGWAPAVQLAVVRGPSLPVLRHLAQDPRFQGTVLCEISPSLFFTHTPGFDREIGRYIDSYESFGLTDLVEQRLAMLVQGNLVTRLSRLQPIVIRNALIFRQMPTPRYEGVIDASRFRHADYRKVRNIAALNARIARELSGPDPSLLDGPQFEARMKSVARYVGAIQERGGRVIFLRLPSSNQVLAREQRLWPRERWWDVFAGETSAASIHFADEPLLAGFVPPDGDHLGGQQAIAFARRLGRILVDRELAPGNGGG